MKILFVCTGNTCRSCMAEAIFNNICDINNVVASSAGVFVICNSTIFKNANTVLMKNLNIDLKNRKAVQLNKEMILKADLILTMTNDIKKYITQKSPEFFDKVFTFNEYVGKIEEVIDPYGENIDKYNKTFFQLKENVELLISKIKEDNSIN